MPKLLAWLSVIGTAAMLWVGGHILLVGFDELGLGVARTTSSTTSSTPSTACPASAACSPGWSTPLASAIVGFVVGVVIATVVERLPRRRASADGTH